MTAPERIRILVVDDHPVVRDGLRAILERQPHLTVVAEAATGEGALAEFRRHRPDVTLMDLRLRGMGGLEATAPAKDAAAGDTYVLSFKGDALVVQTAPGRVVIQLNDAAPVAFVYDEQNHRFVADAANREGAFEAIRPRLKLLTTLIDVLMRKTGTPAAAPTAGAPAGLEKGIDAPAERLDEEAPCTGDWHNRSSWGVFPTRSWACSIDCVARARAAVPSDHRIIGGACNFANECKCDAWINTCKPSDGSRHTFYSGVQECPDPCPPGTPCGASSCSGSRPQCCFEAFCAPSSADCCSDGGWCPGGWNCCDDGTSSCCPGGSRCCWLEDGPMCRSGGGDTSPDGSESPLYTTPRLQKNQSPASPKDQE